MSGRKKTPVRLKGLYLRGSKYWFRMTVDGHQIREPLDTDDEAQAVRKALEIRANPTIAVSTTIMKEVRQYASRQFPDQADRLIRHGLVADRDELIATLKRVSYYRLNGYWPCRLKLVRVE